MKGEGEEGEGEEVLGLVRGPIKERILPRGKVCFLLVGWLVGWLVGDVLFVCFYFFKLYLFRP